jgi:phage baseplate assembly protein V
LGKGEYAGYARVYFDDVDIISDWLALPSCATLKAKCWIPIEINSQVACVIDDDTKQGFIANVLWSRPDAPPEWATDKRMGIMFEDGAKFYYDYDPEKQELTIDAPKSKLNITCGSLIVTGKVDITGDVDIKGKTLNIEVEETVDITGKTKITGDTNIEGNVDITKNTEIKGEVTVKEKTNLEKDVSVAGKITATKEVIAGRISLTEHIHTLLGEVIGKAEMPVPPVP